MYTWMYVSEMYVFCLYVKLSFSLFKSLLAIFSYLLLISPHVEIPLFIWTIQYLYTFTSKGVMQNNRELTNIIDAPQKHFLRF